MKKYRFPFFLTIILLMLPNAGCEKKVIEDPPGDPVPIELSVSEKSLARSSNQFSFDIFNLMQRKKI